MKKMMAAAMLGMALTLAGCGNLAWSSARQEEEAYEPPEMPADPAAYEKLAFTRLDEEEELPGDVIPINLSELPEGRFLIDREGDYLLTGSLEGQIYVELCRDERVRLYLQDVSIQSKDGPALWIRRGGKAIVTLMEGSDNELSDGEMYLVPDMAEACLFSECDLTINGSGSLRVSGNYRGAVRGKDVVKLLNASITASALRDGIRGNDGVRLRGVRLEIDAGENGIVTTDAGLFGRGDILAEDSDFSIRAGNYGLWSAGGMGVSDCILSIDAGAEDYLASGSF